MITLKHLLVCVLGLAALTLGSCQKEPSTGSLNREFLVYTAYDSNADFENLSTYYVADSILLIGNHTKAEYWKDGQAMQIVNEVVSGMNDCGFVRVADKDAADVGLQLSYVEQKSYYVGSDYPYWWSYYPYYWAPGYWGNWAGWYQPYYVQYAYTAGSLLIEMVELVSESETTPKKLPVVWDAFIGGILTSSERINLQRTLEAVEQAFEQSTYLDKRNR